MTSVGHLGWLAVHSPNREASCEQTNRLGRVKVPVTDGGRDLTTRTNNVRTQIDIHITASPQRLAEHDDRADGPGARDRSCRRHRRHAPPRWQRQDWPPQGAPFTGWCEQGAATTDLGRVGETKLRYRPIHGSRTRSFRRRNEQVHAPQPPPLSRQRQRPNMQYHLP